MSCRSGREASWTLRWLWGMAWAAMAGCTSSVTSVASADEAWAAAQRIGLPVVVKPQDGNQGKGVTVNITTREALVAAYDSAAHYGEVMVEKFLPGFDYRLLVVGDRLVAAARRGRAGAAARGRGSARR